MSDRLPIGPYRVVDAGPGASFPFYVIPFDRDGRCEGPMTRDHLLQAVRGGDFTDVFLFSHGWNNDWEAATGRYEHFLAGYLESTRSRDPRYPRPVRPVLIGIFWPSTALVLPWEEAPGIAAAPDAATMDAAVSQERAEVRSIAEVVPEAGRERLYTLAQQDEITADEALELASMLLPLYAPPDDDIPARRSEGEAPDPAALVDIWRATARRRRADDTSGEFGMLLDEADTAPLPESAGLLDRLDPRQIIRLATVLQMKDRAGRVGAAGVGPLLRDVLAASQEARIHLIGHSYGCKVILTALCAEPLPRAVTSALLLQPAISHLCFAADATGDGQPGGYRLALDRVEQPILTTFSADDVALHDLFHRIVRRAADLGEARIAGGPPSRFAALGGYGPGGCAGQCVTQPINPAGTAYPLGAHGGPRVIGLDGAHVITGHGAISNAHVWWALYQQVVA